MGRYPALPPVYSEPLSAILTLMLRVSPTQRPTAAQLLAHPEIVKKISQLNYGGQEPIEKNSIMNTIKVPMALKRLNEALPKACYPSQVSSRDNHDLASVPETESVSSRSNAPPLPPTGRRPLAPLTNVRKADGSEYALQKEPKRPSIDPPSMHGHHHHAPRPPLVPLPENSKADKGEAIAKAEPTEPAPRVRFNRRLW